MKYKLVALSAAMLLAGCAADDVAGDSSGGAAVGQAIVLGVNDVVSPVTRSQYTGTMNMVRLETTGFGVYGYEGSAAYKSSTKEYNLFPPNTPVSFIAGGTTPTAIVDHPGSWTYDGELKEWDADKQYTFFAYAPYMSAGEGTEGTNAGINTIPTGSVTGDPTITYTVAENPAESVDLLWGVRTDTKEKSGLPWVDVKQGQTASAVMFTFYHALCGLGLHAQVMVDQENDTLDLGDLSQMGTIGDANGCKVTLKSITITPKGFPNAKPAVAATLFHKSAKLNLNNTTAHQPLWQDHSGTISSLVLDGGEIDEALLDPHTDHEDDATGYGVMDAAGVPGITEAANSQAIIADDNMFMLIPQKAQDYKVTIEYFITYKTGASTYHRELKTGTVTIRNLELAAGVKYYLNLVFGLTTFKLHVLATDWEEKTVNTTVVIENGTSASSSLAK